MRSLLTLALLLSTSMVAFALDATCATDEQVMFFCKIRHSSKQVSICASKDLTSSTAHLTYRYGSEGKPELTFPNSADDSLNAFSHWHYSRYQTDYFELRFTNGAYSYAVFDYFQGEEPIKYRRGVTVKRSGEDRPVKELSCEPAAVSRLHQLSKYVPCDEADDECRRP